MKILLCSSNLFIYLKKKKKKTNVGWLVANPKLSNPFIEGWIAVTPKLGRGS